MKKIEMFFERIRNNPKTILGFKIAFCFLLAFLSFSILSFDSFQKLHYITYFLIVISIVFSFSYCLIFKFKNFDYKLFYLIPFIFFAAFSTLIGTHSFSNVYTLILLFAFLLCLYVMFSCINDFKHAALSIIVGITIFMIYFIIVYRHQIFTLNFNDRLGSYFGNENSVAIGFSLALLFIFVLAFFNKKYLWLFALSIPLIVCILFTGSKKGLLMIIFPFVICFIVRFWHKKIIIIIFAVLVAISIVLLFSLPQTRVYFQRMIDALSIFSAGSNDASSVERYLMMQESYYHGFEKFIFGYGASGFSINSIYHTYSHNNGGEILCNFGIVGFLCFYYPFIRIVLDLKKEQPLKATIYSYIFIIILFTFTCVFYLDKIMVIIYALAIQMTNKCDIFTHLKNDYKVVKKVLSPNRITFIEMEI